MFYLLAAAMIALALCFLLPSLLRDPGRDALDRARRALEQAHASGAIDHAELTAKLARLPARAAGSTAGRAWPLAAALALLLPLAAGLLYFRLGEPRALDASERHGATAVAASDQDSAPPNMEQAVAGLAERLRAEPDNLDGWLLLGRAYKTMERFEPAREALANAYRLAPDDADVLVEYAEAQALASPGRRIEGEPLTLIERALTTQPDHQRGLWLRGVAAMQAEQPTRALESWQRLRTLLAADADAVASLDQQIAGARQAAGLPVLPVQGAPATTGGAAETAAPTPARLTVQIDVAEELRARVQPSDVLFVFARAVEGSRMPLAIQRLPAGTLPTTVTLDDRHSMVAGMTLSSLNQVVVGARISKSGQAIPQSGDFEAVSEPVPTRGQRAVELTIRSVLP